MSEEVCLGTIEIGRIAAVVAREKIARCGYLRPGEIIHKLISYTQTAYPKEGLTLGMKGPRVMVVYGRDRTLTGASLTELIAADHSPGTCSET